MNETERSTGTLLLALAAAALLATSLALPWFTYASSTGRRTPEGGFQDPSDNGAIHHDMAFGAAKQVSGDVQPDRAAQAKQVLQGMGLSGASAAGLLLLVALGSAPGVARIVPRRLNLVLMLLAGASGAIMLALAWFWLPQTIDNVTGPFTSQLVGDTYIRTSLEVGWAAAALALPLAAGAFLFQFQAGSSDPSLVEAYAHA